MVDVKSTPVRELSLCIYVTDILKICMKKFDAEFFFSHKLTGILI